MGSVNKIKILEYKYPFIYRLIMKGLFMLIIGLMTGNCYLSLDGEELSSDEGDSSSTKTKPESSQDISQTNPSDKNDGDSNTNPSEDKMYCSQEELLKDRPERIEDMFQKLYLQMHDHENTLLKEERTAYTNTGQLEDENHHARMAESRRNDYTNLQNHNTTKNIVYTEVDNTTEGESSSAQNKRDHVETQDDSDLNQSNVDNKKRKDSED